MTPLCDIGAKWGTDKSPLILHNYTPIYYEMFYKKRFDVKKVLEVGIGTHATMFRVKNYVVGASLFMWQEFFPNAMVYGADIAPEALISAPRIKTFLCDETKKEDVENLVKQTGTDIDLVVDDADHYYHNQVFLCKTLLPMLQKPVTYIIEDVFHPLRVTKRLKEFNTVLIPTITGKRSYRDNLVIIEYK